jgi:hypothetical protein
LYTESLAALIAFVRRRALAGGSAAHVSRAVRAEAKRALTLLEHGLGDYGVRR